MAEGWARPLRDSTGKKFHWMREGRAICKSRIRDHTLPRTDLTARQIETQGCARCLELLTAEPGEQSS